MIYRKNGYFPWVGVGEIRKSIMLMFLKATVSLHCTKIIGHFGGLWRQNTILQTDWLWSLFKNYSIPPSESVEICYFSNVKREREVIAADSDSGGVGYLLVKLINKISYLLLIPTHLVALSLLLIKTFPAMIRVGKE